MACSKLIFAVVILFQYVGAVVREDLVVDTKVGLIRGLAATDGEYNMFLGIPYAKVDEANPFGPPVAMPNFDGIFDAFDDSVMCPQSQAFGNNVVGSLDCLHVNVYVPTSASSSNPLPVLVWIFGGAYTTGLPGRDTYGPKFLVRHGVILVTLNYRLGPYGFLCLDSPGAPGNQGLKDQQIALRWIKDNIEAFNGDSNKITIFGQSAGAKSIDFHIHFSEDNLFHQAILQSGSILTPGLITNPGNDAAFKLAEHLGHVTTDVNDALSFISTIDSNTIIASVSELGLHFEICVEKQFDGVETLVVDHPINLKLPKSKNIPILIGCNDDEELVGSGRANFSNPEIVENVLRRSFEFDDVTLDEMTKFVRQFYYGDKEMSEDTKRETLNLGTDFRAVEPLRKTIAKYFENGENIFYYMFSYVGLRNYIRHMLNITFGGASHSDEIGYLFDPTPLEDVMPQEDQIMVDRMTTMWTNFAKYGDPTPEITDLLPVKWIPATRDKWNFLEIGSELVLSTRPFNKRMAFLELFFLMNYEYQIGYRSDNDD